MRCEILTILSLGGLAACREPVPVLPDEEKEPTEIGETDSGAPPWDEAAFRDEVRALGFEPWGDLPFEEGPAYWLGGLLFVEPLLEENHKRPCAACHFAWGPEGRDFSMKQVENGFFYGRNIPTFQDIGRPEVTTFFWDGLVRVEDGRVRSPIEHLVPHVDDPLVVALMVGGVHVPTVFREPVLDEGEVDTASALDWEGRWQHVMDELLAADEYLPLFRQAFPEVRGDAFTYEHVARAIAAYVRPTFLSRTTRFDRWLAGESGVLSPSELRGAVLFFGKAGCVTCHTGPAFSDGKAHALSFPQMGPGVGVDAPEDLGAYRVTGRDRDRYAFVTPRLRNLLTSGAYGHDGVYDNLRDVVLHHLDPLGRLGTFRQEDVVPTTTFDGEARVQIPVRLPLAYPPKEAVRRMGPYLSDALPRDLALDDREVQDLVDFLRTLDEVEPFARSRRLPPTAVSGLYPFYF